MKVWGEETGTKQSFAVSTEEELKRAQLYSMNLLTGMDRTEAQVREKLRSQGFSEEVEDTCIRWLYGFHYLDDLRYAEHFIRVGSAKKNRIRLTADLKLKGVSDEIIRAAFENGELEEDYERELIRKELRKKRFDPMEEDREKERKVLASLLRKGFSYGDIRACMSENREE